MFNKVNTCSSGGPVNRYKYNSTLISLNSLPTTNEWPLLLSILAFHHEEVTNGHCVMSFYYPQILVIGQRQWQMTLQAHSFLCQYASWNCLSGANSERLSVRCERTNFDKAAFHNLMKFQNITGIKKYKQIKENYGQSSPLLTCIIPKAYLIFIFT